MIASVLKLNRADCNKHEIKDAYSIHKIVYSLFPQRSEESRDFLFADKGGDWNTRQILILSKRKPVTPVFGELISRDIPESFLNYDYYGFEIILNPTTKNGPSRKVTPVRGVEHLHTWFIRKAPTLGFEVDPTSLEVRHVGVQRFDKSKGDTVYSHTHGSATFFGKLKVIDRLLFKKSFEHGIGRAKGFGFGMLQIVPIRN